MERILSAQEVMGLASEATIFDVRSPGEYERGHIPGALSFPLFTNEERAEVGTIYKQIGKQEALVRGLEMVGPKMGGFVREALRLTRGKKHIIIHCWRGGQRSKSMAWLLTQAGMRVAVMQGGYKAWRHVTQQNLDQMPHRLLVVGGSTGSGKTLIMHALRAAGEQVIDLEQLANHKGSAFGWLGEQEQPSTEHFENLLAAELRGLDPKRRTWVENESKGIGRVYLPVRLREAMKETALFQYQLDIEARLDILVDGYAQYSHEELVMCFERIHTKLGGLAFQQAVDAVNAGDYRTAARIALVYYDKTYEHSLQVNQTPVVVPIVATLFDASEAAQALISAANAHAL
jgi:tRNA 2-selenouridine synthase